LLSECVERDQEFSECKREAQHYGLVPK